MISFKIMKKDLKDALAVSKRVIPKKIGVTKLVGNNGELHIFSKGEHIQVFDYKSLVGDTQPFAIEVDPTVVDKWLDKANREMEFQIVTEKKTVKKKEVLTTSLLCVEKKLSVNVSLLENPEKQFRNARVLEYKPFKNPVMILDTFNEVNKSFQSSKRLFSDYAKFTDINMFVFDPLFFLVFLYQEDLGILTGHGNNGIAIHKEALDVLSKSVKKPKDFGHILLPNNHAFLIREENTVFWMDYKTDIPFPDYLSIKSAQDEKCQFVVDADEINEALKTFPNAKVGKVSIGAENKNEATRLLIKPDNAIFDSVTLSASAHMPRGVFPIAPLKSFFDGLTGAVEITRVTYNSKTTKEGYFWMYRDKVKSKMMPGIQEAPGFQFTDEELTILREQLQEEIPDISADYETFEEAVEL